MVLIARSGQVVAPRFFLKILTSVQSRDNKDMVWIYIRLFLDKISEVFGGQASGKLSFLRNFSVFFWKWLSFLEQFSVFMAISSCFPQFSAKMLTFWVKSVKSYQFSWKNWKILTFSPFWKPENRVFSPWFSKFPPELSVFSAKMPQFFWRSVFSGAQFFWNVQKKSLL